MPHPGRWRPPPWFPGERFPVILSLSAHAALLGLLLIGMVTHRVERPETIVELVLEPVSAVARPTLASATEAAPSPASASAPVAATVPPPQVVTAQPVDATDPAPSPLLKAAIPALAPVPTPLSPDDIVVAEANVPSPEPVSPAPAVLATLTPASSVPHRPTPKPVPHRVVQRSAATQAAPPTETSPSSQPFSASVAPVGPERPVAPPASPSVPLPSWQSEVAAWLAAHKHYPDEARQDGKEGAVGVRFTVARDGRVEAVTIERPSGIPALDLSVREMLQDKSVPRFPPAMTELQTTVRVTVRFEIDR